jgi:hypothetical protein
MHRFPFLTFLVGLAACNLTINADDLGKIAGGDDDGSRARKTLVGEWSLTQVDDQVWPFYYDEYLVSGSLVADSALNTTFTETWANDSRSWGFLYTGSAVEEIGEDGSRSYTIHVEGEDGYINFYCAMGDANTLYCQDDALENITFMRAG